MLGRSEDTPHFLQSTGDSVKEDSIQERGEEGLTAKSGGIQFSNPTFLTQEELWACFQRGCSGLSTDAQLIGLFPRAFLYRKSKALNVRNCRH